MSDSTANPKCLEAGKSQRDDGSRNVSKSSVAGPPPAVQRSIGPIAATSMLISTMVGSGIFGTPATIAESIGSPLTSLLLWVFGAVVSLCGALTYGELGGMFPQSGGELVYFTAAFPNPRNLIPFLFVWTRVILVDPGFTACLADLTASYLFQAFSGTDVQSTTNESEAEFSWGDFWLQKSMRVLVIWLCSGAVLYSTKFATTMGTIASFFKCTLLAFIAICGVLAATRLIGGNDYQGAFDDGFQNTSTDPGLWAHAVYRVLFAFDGWNLLASSAAEVKDPLRTLPLAAGGSILVVATLYVVVIVGIFLPLSVKQIESSKLIGATWANQVFGEIFGNCALPILIAFSTFGGSLAGVFWGSRMAQASSASFSPILYQNGFRITGNVLHWVGARRADDVPVNAAILTTGISTLMILCFPAGKAFNYLLDAQSFPTWIIYGFVGAAMLTLRFTRPDLDRPFRCFVLFPICVVLLSVFVTIFALTNKGWDDLIPQLVAFSVMALGTVPYLIFRLHAHDPVISSETTL